MEKDTFKLEVDLNSGLRYIIKVKDEETKNHKETDQDIISGFMAEKKESKYCPVTSFLRYTNALSPKSNRCIPH